MSRDLRTPKPDVLSDPAQAPWRAAQRVAALGEGWALFDVPPEGEVIWRKDGDTARVTLDGWLVYLNGGEGGLDAKRLCATLEWIPTMRGERGRAALTP